MLTFPFFPCSGPSPPAQARDRDALHFIHKYMHFPHHHQGREEASVNAIVFHEAGVFNYTLTCPSGGRDTFYVAVGENHARLPDELEFTAVAETKPSEGLFQHWRYIRCDDSSSHTFSLQVSAGTQLGVAVRPERGQNMATTWRGNLQIHFAPDASQLQLKGARVQFYGTQWDYGSTLTDSPMPANWYFPLRLCAYGLLTLQCPSDPPPILAMLFGHGFMQSSLCHACLSNPPVENLWKELAKMKHLNGGFRAEGATPGSTGVAVMADW